jgi:hypothetical protein
MVRRLAFVTACSIALLLATGPRAYGQRHARKEAANAESAAPRSVKGGATFQVPVAYEKAYEGILNHLKRQGYSLDVADRDAGQLVTAMDIKGGYSQTGTRVQVTCIKDSDAQTSVRVAVTEQKRKKLLQVEPWGDPKVNEEASAKLAEEFKSAISSAT